MLSRYQNLDSEKVRKFAKSPRRLKPHQCTNFRNAGVLLQILYYLKMQSSSLNLQVLCSKVNMKAIVLVYWFCKIAFGRVNRIQENNLLYHSLQWCMNASVYHYYNVIINTSSYADPIGQNMQTNAKNCLFCMPDELATECMTLLMSNN